MSIRWWVPLVFVLGACGDDGSHHLADAPLPTDADIDAPGSSDLELSVTLAGAGSGTITSSPAGIACGATCTSSFPKDTVVTLTASPATGSVFSSWGGACSGTLPTCDVTLADVKSVTATFDVAKYTVTVTRAGAGTGTVSGNGLNCGTTCSIEVAHGTMLDLAAAPGNLSVFAGWGGACSGNAACTVTVTGTTAITANFALDNLTLFVTRGGNGTGTVTSAPAGINCGADCSETYTANQMVTLTAAPATGSTFTGWSGGGCTGTGTCTVTMTAATTVTATFTLMTNALTVTRAGNGSGSVTSNPAGIACGADCTEPYNYGQMVTLTATPSTGSTFTGWTGGGCAGTAACVVTVTAATAVTATFTLDVHALAVTKMGTGAGTVTGTGINCGADCTENFNYGTMVTLSAAPSIGSTFGGWAGACTGTGACTVTMDAAKNVTATFTLNTYTLTVATAGNGTGTVTGTGINCGTDCTEVFGHGTMVTLTPAAGTGSSFAGWSGACTGTGACSVPMTMAQSVTATFTLDTPLLSVSKAGNGTGTVTGTGINCGVDCSEMINYGTMVTLTAAAGTGSTFTGWSGACTGTGACTVSMTVARSVTATFTLNTFVLTVATMGTGSGQVTATGITCGAGGTDCTETLNYGTMVTLTPTASMGSTFAGWSGDCTGTGACTVTMTQARSVTASFTINSYLLTVTPAGNGTGTVTATGINCPGDCTESYVYNTMVTLTAMPAMSSNFTGWGLPCNGTGTCTVTMDQARTLTATFTLKTFTVSATTSGTGAGTVSGTGTVNYGGSVTLTANPSMAAATLSTFTGWTGAGCAGLGGCVVSNITSNVTVDASFKLSPNIMFVTSGIYTAALGGLSGADTICNSLARSASLAGNYVAYLSAGAANPAPTRVGVAKGWVRVDGKPVMNDVSEMSTGLMNAPSVNELNQDVSQSSVVWAFTGTTSTGQSATNVCGSPAWTSSTAGETPVGLVTSVTSQVILRTTTGCSTMQRLYCLGVDRSAPVN